MLQRFRSALAGVAARPPARDSASSSASPPRLRRPPCARAIMGRAARASRAANGPRLRRQLLADEDNPAIIDVGSGWSGSDEVAQGLEEARRIVLGEKRRGIKTLPARAMQGRRIDQGSRRIAGGPAAAVGSVGISRKGSDIRVPIERDRE